MSANIGLVGAGLVGSGWAIVFARAGYRVRAYDSDPSTRASLLDRVATNAQSLEAHRLVDDAKDILENVEAVDTMDAALEDAVYVQESVLERADVKRGTYEAIDKRIGSDVPVGSSSSGIPASAFTEGLRHTSNYLVAHPVNPPYLHPLVELVPSPWTNKNTVARVNTLLEQCGQIPIHVNGEIDGFILNRLQGALLREAWALYEEGYANTKDIDNTVKHGLGLRWSFMGPFETIDLNAPGGVRDYAKRLGGLYLSIARDRTDPQPWTEALIARVESERRAELNLRDIPRHCTWRDNRLMALAAHKASADTAQNDNSD